MVRSTTALVALLAPCLAAAAELHVGQGQSYSTIQAAIDAAQNNDVVVVHAGTYDEQLVIDDATVQNLTIAAYSTDTVLVRTPDTKVNGIIANTVNLRLRGITLDAPEQTSPAARGIQFVSTTAAGADVFTLTLCDVSLVGDSITDSLGVECTVGQDDALDVVGRNTTIESFSATVGSTCGFTGWEKDDESENLSVCAGW